MPQPVLPLPSPLPTPSSVHTLMRMLACQEGWGMERVGEGGKKAPTGVATVGYEAVQLGGHAVMHCQQVSGLGVDGGCVGWCRV